MGVGICAGVGVCMYGMYVVAQGQLHIFVLRPGSRLSELASELSGSYSQPARDLWVRVRVRVRVSPLPILPSLGYKHTLLCPVFCVGSRDTNAGLYALETNELLPEPSA